MMIAVGSVKASPGVTTLAALLAVGFLAFVWTLAAPSGSTDCANRSVGCSANDSAPMRASDEPARRHTVVLVAKARYRLIAAHSAR